MASIMYHAINHLLNDINHQVIVHQNVSPKPLLINCQNLYRKDMFDKPFSLLLGWHINLSKCIVMVLDKKRTRWDRKLKLRCVWLSLYGTDVLYARLLCIQVLSTVIMYRLQWLLVKRQLTYHSFHFSSSPLKN